MYMYNKDIVLLDVLDLSLSIIIVYVYVFVVFLII